MFTEAERKTVKLRLRETHKIMDRKAKERRGKISVQFFCDKDSESVLVNNFGDWICPHCATLNHVQRSLFLNPTPYSSDICSGCGRSFLLDF
jgi:hypothetical protein